jgi:hypothetical protein
MIFFEAITQAQPLEACVRERWVIGGLRIFLRGGRGLLVLNFK